MKKKISLLILAIVLCFTGGLVALGCGGGNSDPQTWTVTYVDTAGETITTKTVNDGQKVDLTDVTEPEKAGYDVVWKVNGAVYDWNTEVKGNITVTAEFVAKTDTAYKVVYYLENLNGGYDEYETENKTGTTDATVTADPAGVQITGAEFAASNSGNVLTSTVKADGSTVLKVYYDRTSYAVSFIANGQTLDTANVKYGATVAPTDNEVADVVDESNKTTYKKFKYWSTAENGEEYNFSTQVSGELTLYAVYEEAYFEFSVDIALGSDYYYLLNENGDYYEDLDVDMNAFHYGDTFKFAFELTEEATGTPVVTANGENVEGVDGLYTVTVNGDVAITVEIESKKYSVIGSVAMYQNANGEAWTKIIDSLDEVVIKVDGEYYEGAVTEVGGYSVSGLVKGDYELEFYAVDGKSYRPISNDKVAFSVSSAIVGDADALELSDVATVGYTAFTADNDGWVIADNGALENGKFNGNNKDNVNFTFSGVDLSGDFAVTVSYDQSIDDAEVSTEAEPTLGYKFTDKDGNYVLLSILNSGNVKFNYNGQNESGAKGNYFSGQGSTALLCGAGGIMGMSEWPDCYRRATLTYVKSGSWLHIYFTGDSKGDNNVAKAYENLLLMSIDLTNGKIYMKETMQGNGANLVGTGTYYVRDMAPIADVFANLDSATALFWTAKACYADITNWGYTTDAEVIESYVKNTTTKFTVTTDENVDVSYTDAFIDGENGSKILSVLGYEGTQKITLKFKDGYSAKSIKINGVASGLTANDDGEIIIEYKKTSAREPEIVIEVESIQGTYVSFSGTIDGSAVAGFDSLDNPMVRIYNDEVSYEIAAEDGEWSARILDGTYNVEVIGTSYYASSVVENVTKDVKAENVLKERVLGGSATVGNTTYYSGGCSGNYDSTPMLATEFIKHSYVVEEIDGKEVTSSTASTPARQAMLFSGFSAEKFVVRATYTYTNVYDRWNRLGFYVVDEDGQWGHIGTYASTVDAIGTMAVRGVDSNSWQNLPSSKTVIRSMTGKENGWYNSGYTLEYAMVYDNGEIMFFVKADRTIGFGWECIYSGKMLTWGTKASDDVITTWGPDLVGPVAVGLVDTQNGMAATWNWSNYSAVAGQEAIDAFLAQTVKLSAEAEGKVTADLDGDATIDLETEEYRFITLTPKTEGEYIVDVKVNGVSSENVMFDTATGKANLYLAFDVDVSELVIDVTTSTDKADYAREATTEELVDNGDGTYSSTFDTSLPQETAIKADGEAVTFTPATQKLVFTYSTTWTGKVGIMDNYDFQAGMFIRSAEGGMLRFGWTRAGDVLRMRTANYRMSGNYVATDEKNPWTALGNASGYHSSGHTNKLYIRVTVDGYNWKVESKTGDGCACKKDWCLVREFSVFDDYNTTTATNNFNAAGTYDAGVVNNMFLNDLYKLDLPCTFGLSTITEAGVDKVVHFADVAYEIINK